MNTETVLPSADALQAWANSPDTARSNLPSIFSCLSAEESRAEWAAEALENCGKPLETDIAFLAEATMTTEGDVAFWACKLLGRLGVVANDSQSALCSVLLSEQTSAASRHQAAIALGVIGKLNAMSREALQKASESKDPRLARLSIQSLVAAS